MAADDVHRPPLATTVGALCLTLMFLLSGVHKVGHYASTVESVRGKALPLPQLAVAAVVLLEIAAPLTIASALAAPTPAMLQVARVAAALLAAFTVVVTPLYHPLDLSKGYMKNLPFWSNVSLLGGLLLLTQALGPPLPPDPSPPDPPLLDPPDGLTDGRVDGV